ncbi:protein NLP2-like [Rhodamnia argentea]|uniref:Protein NLP2-like n=1 Tax=Rhodamnia argentea TaxID=178133 RepID=A0A8B8MQN0_9MYRT|nr:protein NLP2-like [Rhodamnia argentea]XP_030512906.2 protein NLP2-like [Rhodamnia argentea]XP_030512907.2 protein NLP2-like [Rhodamnia argentea]XP_048135353.1 protein NLP2-like [Rhodamnia argentea]
MENGPPTPQSPFENLADVEMDLDFLDEFFLDGCWVETADAFSLCPRSPTSAAPNEAPNPSFSEETHTSNPNTDSYQNVFQDETRGNDSSGIPPSADPQTGELVELRTQDACCVRNATSLGQVQGTEVSKRLWIAPKSSPGLSSSIKLRLMQAISHLSKSIKDKDMLIQIWVPVRKEGRRVLTTDNQPFSLGLSSRSLEIYRSVSKSYQFSAEDDSKDHLGLPGLVFLGKLPEWTPDVRFFSTEEYPRINYARKYDVRGSLAVPVFEHGSGTCLGVVEVVMTSQKINYRRDLENVCKALEAVDLRSTQSFNPSTVKVDVLYEAVIPRSLEVLKSVSKTYNLPLALTWASCVKQGKEGCRHSDENYSLCLSPMDSACLAADLEMLGFHEACSEHHLLKGQGIVGKAFTTDKPCFSNDITAFGHTEYPLSHHAKFFGLQSALAIPVINIYTGLAEFVLELFLPKDFGDMDQGKQTLNLLCADIHQTFQNSQFMTEKELCGAIVLPVREIGVATEMGLQKKETEIVSSSRKQTSSEESSWIAHMVETQTKGNEVSISPTYDTGTKEAFNITTEHQEFWHLQQNSEHITSVEGRSNSLSLSRHSRGSGKAGEKRRTKMEKTISMDVLRQYFAGSLKDAAEKIGVCPTTLKRICRQHGITRWPSRKIKKVNHSLKKLQHVIDSVQGAEGTIKLGSFYASFPEQSPKITGYGSSSSKQSGPPKETDHQPDINIDSSAATTSKSPSTSCSQSSTSCSSGEIMHSTTIVASSARDGQMIEDPLNLLKSTGSHPELHVPPTNEPKIPVTPHSHKSFGQHPLPNFQGQHLQDGLIFKVKATFGEEKIRLALQPTWGFADLRQEIAKRFRIDDVGEIDLKYLDDDTEWVLLTCDADLEECMDVYRASEGHTIRISVHPVSHSHKNSFESSGNTGHHKHFL